MTRKQFRKLLGDYCGWIDGEFLRFPTPHQMSLFEKAVAALAEKEGR